MQNEESKFKLHVNELPDCIKQNFFLNNIYRFDDLQEILEAIKNKNLQHMHKFDQDLQKVIESFIEFEKSKSFIGMKYDQFVATIQFSCFIAMIHTKYYKFNLADNILQNLLHSQELKLYNNTLLHAHVLDRDGDVKRKMGAYDASLKLHEEAQRIKEEIYCKRDTFHIQQVYSLQCIGYVKHSMELQNQSLIALKQAQQIYNMVKDDIETREYPREDIEDLEVVLIFQIARSYRELQKFEEATQFILQAIKMREKIDQQRKRQGADTAICLEIYGWILWYQDKFEQAKKLFEEVRQIRSHLLGEIHPDLASIKDCLGLTYFKQHNASVEQKRMGIDLCRESLAMKTQIFELDTPTVAQQFFNLAWVLQSHNELEEALTNYKLAAKHFFLGYHSKPHPDISNALTNIAIIYLNQNRLNKAKKYYLKSLQNFEANETITVAPTQFYAVTLKHYGHLLYYRLQEKQASYQFFYASEAAFLQLYGEGSKQYKKALMYTNRYHLTDHLTLKVTQWDIKARYSDLRLAMLYCLNTVFFALQDVDFFRPKELTHDIILLFIPK